VAVARHRVHGRIRRWDVSQQATPGPPLSPFSTLMKQRIHYVLTDDEVWLTWAEIGRGSGLVKAATWLTHLQNDPNSLGVDTLDALLRRARWTCAG
jgi:hypothetical protein